MMSVKPALTIEKQIQKLRDKGCIINIEDQPELVLNRLNYYRLSGYFLPFKIDDNRYLHGITFARILKIYEFDQKIRNLVSYSLEFIEIDIRTKVSYYHSSKFGPLGYLDSANFNGRYNHTDLICTVQKHKDKEKNNKIIQHHIKNYGGDIPLWAIIEFFSFSELSKFYQGMHRIERKEIAKNYGYKEPLIESWLYCLTFLRNSCAHYSRLYYIDMIPQPLIPKHFVHHLGKSLFDYFVLLKFLQDPRVWQELIFPQLRQLINEYLPHIELNHIGFPSDWNSRLG